MDCLQGTLTQKLTINKKIIKMESEKSTEEVMDQIVGFGTYAICVDDNAAF